SHACEQGSHFGAESFTGMARSHKEPTALWRIIWTSANPDPVGAGHACEQDPHIGAESPHGHGPFPQRADSPLEDHMDISKPRSCRSRPSLRTRLHTSARNPSRAWPVPTKSWQPSPPMDPTGYSSRPATA